ncbi:MAG: hypothetical protein IJU34_04415 [Bacteroidales bacterium]|nr:hypothetical protein [Bacteroidales bacterium]
MKKLSFCSLSLAAAIALASVSACTIKELDPQVLDGEGVVLRFFSDESLVVTKATTQKNGEDALNENKLASVEYFLYSDAQKDGDALFHGYLENVAQNAPVSIPMTIEVVNNTLCPNGATNFWVYAIANHPRIVAEADPEVLSGTDVATLAAKTREIEFDGGNVKTPQTNFLMATDGLFEVTPVYRRNTVVATANIGLKRVAAKITIAVRVVPQVEIRNTVTISGVTDTRTEIWKPRMNGMYVYLVNGARTGQVSGAPVDNPGFYSYQQVEFNLTAPETHEYETYTKVVDGDGNEILDGNGLVQYNKTTTTGTFYPANSPFYTYPESWMYGTDEEPYLKLAIPWDREPGESDNKTPYGATSKIYYYRVYCPATAIDMSNAQFLRNNWYKVILNVGILGSETDGGEMVINGNYYVVDWQEREDGGGGSSTGNDTDKEAEIKGARYLFLNEQNFTMYNLEDLMIPYVTSDPCIIENFSAKKYDFSGSTKQEVTTTSMAAWNMDVNLVTTATGAHISFTHPLNNDTSTNDFDVSQYIITFTLRHKDDPSYAKVVTITQYPAIVIDAKLNSDGNSDTHHGYVFIDNSSSTSDYTATWKRRTAITGGSNSNPNMYLISTSVLSDSDMLIGDPRTSNKYKDSDLVSGWASSSAPCVDGTSNRRLTNYYPTSQDEASSKVIAPVFRIASSHGQSSRMSYSDAQRRCASYQEDGCPAGRWRIPTMSEVLFITTLSQKNMIPKLFTFADTALDESYWCANGKIDGVNGVPTYFSGTDGTRWVRCVYDEWYWSGMEEGVSTVTNTTFTWGDIAR